MGLGRRMARAMLAAPAAWLVGAGTAEALTMNGTVITNVCSITCRGGSPALHYDYEVSYAVTATVAVQSPQVWIGVFKTVSPSVQGSGGVLTYQVWLVNTSDDSAWNVTVTDQLPENSTYAGAQSAWDAGGGGTWFESYGPAAGPAMAAGVPPAGQGTPLYLRWVLTRLGPLRSALVEYSAEVL